MTDPSGAESPSSVGPFLVWQQPHPIYYAELVYRERRDRATLERFRDVVFETAEFMASFAAWDEAAQRFVLGPPLQGAQEIFPKQTHGQLPRSSSRTGAGGSRPRSAGASGSASRARSAGTACCEGSLALPVRDGRYLFAETAPDSYDEPRWARDHPSVTGALGMLPGPGVDTETMRRSFDWIWTHWSFPDTWGWDYPLLAMCAARLGEPARAVDALLMDTPKNVYRPNGHNHQRPGLTIYLPGNGGLLAAVAMMAGGWDGAPEKPAPGFPDDGSWTVRAEGFQRMP